MTASRQVTDFFQPDTMPHCGCINIYPHPFRAEGDGVQSFLHHVQVCFFPEFFPAAVLPVQDASTLAVRPVGMLCLHSRGMFRKLEIMENHVHRLLNFEEAFEIGGPRGACALFPKIGTPFGVVGVGYPAPMADLFGGDDLRNIQFGYHRMKFQGFEVAEMWRCFKSNKWLLASISPPLAPSVEESIAMD